MAMGKRQLHAEPPLFIIAADLPQSVSHPFYCRLNELLAAGDFDQFAPTLALAESAPSVICATVAVSIYGCSSGSFNDFRSSFALAVFATRPNAPATPSEPPAFLKSVFSV